LSFTFSSATLAIFGYASIAITLFAPFNEK